MTDVPRKPSIMLNGNALLSIVHSDLEGGAGDIVTMTSPPTPVSPPTISTGTDGQLITTTPWAPMKSRCRLLK